MLSLLVASLVFPSTPAGAGLGDCNVVHQIFMYGNVLLSNSNGTTNRIYFQQRTLDANCKGQAYSTAHSARGIPRSAGYGTFIEVGWVRKRNADGTVEKCLYRNKAVDFSYTPVSDCGNISDFDYGEYDRYRVQNLSGTIDWRVFTDLNDDIECVPDDFSLVKIDDSTVALAVQNDYVTSVSWLRSMEVRDSQTFDEFASPTIEIKVMAPAGKATLDDLISVANRF